MHSATSSSPDVIIVNYNSGSLLRSCINSLRDQTRPPGRIIVVDNASADGSVDSIDLATNVEIYRSVENLGFAKGNNWALARSEADLVALLNPDTLADRDWLRQLCDAADTFPDAAAFGSCQVAYESADRLDGIGDIFHLSGAAWRDGYGSSKSGRKLKPREIFSPCAAAALYRRQALMEIGGFDEDYFCYMEDVDVGFRLRLQGYAARFVPDALVRHVGSATTGGQNSDFAVYHGHRNLVWTFIKDVPSPMFWLLIPGHILLNIGSLLWFTLRGQGRVIWRAKWAAIRGIPLMWQKRKSVQAKRRVSASAIWRVMDKRSIGVHLLLKVARQQWHKLA